MAHTDMTGNIFLEPSSPSSPSAGEQPQQALRPSVELIDYVGPWDGAASTRPGETHPGLRAALLVGVALLMAGLLATAIAVLARDGTERAPTRRSVPTMGDPANEARAAVASRRAAVPRRAAYMAGARRAAAAAEAAARAAAKQRRARRQRRARHRRKVSPRRAPPPVATNSAAVPSTATPEPARAPAAATAVPSDSAGGGVCVEFPPC
jgi:hypothetical protein